MTTHWSPQHIRALRGYDLHPSKSELIRIPTLRATHDHPLGEVLVCLHLLAPGADWWITEYDPERATAYGYTRLSSRPAGEWAMISLAALEAIGGIAGDGTPYWVERDWHFTVAPVRDVIPLALSPHSREPAGIERSPRHRTTPPGLVRHRTARAFLRRTAADPQVTSLPAPNAPIVIADSVAYWLAEDHESPSLPAGLYRAPVSRAGHVGWNDATPVNLRALHNAEFTIVYHVLYLLCVQD